MEKDTTLQKFINPSGIEVRPMLERPELHTKEEDWTGKTSTALRRKLQNRLNQRASEPSPPAYLLPGLTNDSPERRRAQELQHSSAAEAQGAKYDVSVEVLVLRPSRISNICIEPSKRRWVLEAADFSSFLSPETPLSADHKLLTLLHFNLIRALTRITLLLGVNPDDMYKDIESPFHDAASNLSLSVLPPTLRPTQMQLSVPHHPEVDVFPFPQFRDNMILGEGLYDDVEFCQDLVYGVDDGKGGERKVDQRNCAKMSTGGRTGLIVWSDPWLQSSWEVEPDFARKYRKLFEGCSELIDGTNRWRASRGEEPLDLSE